VSCAFRAPLRGIISYGQKKVYTPAERKLYTATSGGIDGLLNTISGRKAMLKKKSFERNCSFWIELMIF
jgi:hypothetical protein